MKKIHVFDTTELLADAVAMEIADFIRKNPGALMCFAAGDTPLKVFKRLIAAQELGELDLNSVYYVGLDEWAGLGRETRGSCVQVMQEAFYEPAGIDAEHMCIWDGLAEDLEAECRRMEAFIEAHGPIALTLLGIGMNGHVGFNEPYTNLPEGCVIFPLDETTRKVSVKYFDTPLPVTTGVGVGAGELIKAKRILLMANGVHKAEIIQKTVAGATPAVPSSLMFASEAAELYVDAPAAEHLK